jgi:hypothetical protein
MVRVRVRVRVRVSPSPSPTLTLTLTLTLALALTLTRRRGVRALLGAAQELPPTERDPLQLDERQLRPVPHLHGGLPRRLRVPAVAWHGQRGLRGVPCCEHLTLVLVSYSSLLSLDAHITCDGLRAMHARDGLRAVNHTCVVYTYTRSK